MEVGRWLIRWHRRNAIEAASPMAVTRSGECEILLAAPIIRTVAPLSSGFGEGQDIEDVSAAWKTAMLDNGWAE